MRAISSDLHMDYTAVGQTTHLAARMEQLASPGTTLLTADTLRLAEGYVEVTPLGAMPVKGLPAPVEAYELTGAGPRRSRLSAAAARGLTRFVGRDAELEQLREALGRAAQRARPGGRDRRRAGRREVAARLGGHPLPPDPRLADPRGRLRLVRQGHAVPPGGRVSSEATSRSATGTSPAPSGRRSRASSSTLDRALEPALPAFLALLDVPVEDRRWEALDPPAAAAADARRPDAAPPAGEPGPAAPGRVRGPPLDRRRDAGRARPPGREPADGPAPAPRQLPPGVPARLGREDLLPPAPAGPARAGECDRAAGDPARGRRRPRAPETAPPRADRGQPLLPRGERAEPRGRRGARGRARRVSAGEDCRRPSTCRRRCRRSWRRASTGCRRRTRTCSRRPRSSAPTSRWPCSRVSPEDPRTRWPMASPGSRRPSSSTRRACSRTSSTPSSTRSPTRWPTEASSRSAGVPSTPGPSRPSSDSTPSGSRSTSSAWPTTRSGARRGRRPSPISVRPEGRRWSARPTGRRWPSFEQALDALQHLPESRERTEQAIDLHLDASGALAVNGRAGEEHRPCSRGRGPRRGAGRRAPAGAGPGPARDRCLDGG